MQTTAKGENPKGESIFSQIRSGIGNLIREEEMEEKIGTNYSNTSSEMLREESEKEYDVRVGKSVIFERRAKVDIPTTSGSATERRETIKSSRNWLTESVVLPTNVELIENTDVKSRRKKGEERKMKKVGDGGEGKVPDQEIGNSNQVSNVDESSITLDILRTWNREYDYEKFGSIQSPSSSSRFGSKTDRASRPEFRLLVAHTSYNGGLKGSLNVQVGEVFLFCGLSPNGWVRVQGLDFESVGWIPVESVSILRRSSKHREEIESPSCTPTRPKSGFWELRSSGEREGSSGGINDEVEVSPCKKRDRSSSYRKTMRVGQTTMGPLELFPKEPESVQAEEQQKVQLGSFETIEQKMEPLPPEDLESASSLPKVVTSRREELLNQKRTTIVDLRLDPLLTEDDANEILQKKSGKTTGFFLFEPVGCKVFGGTIASICENSDHLVPPIVFECVMYLMSCALQKQGLFRVSGVYDEVIQLKKQFSNLSKRVNLSKMKADPHAVATVLKAFFTELAEPLIDPEIRSALIKCSENESDLESCTKKSQVALAKLGLHTRLTLYVLLQFLHNLSLHEKFNKMTADNLGIVFGPCLLRSPSHALHEASMSASVIGTLIANFPMIKSGFSLEEEV